MPTRELETPTPEFVAKYIAVFDEDSATTERAIARLVEAFPRNDDLGDVLLKAAVVNSLYTTQIYAIDKMAEHIHDLHVDAKFEQRSLAVVDEIACLEISGKTFHFLSFASKYCSWHVPDTYPIYDSYVERLLWAYQKRDAFTGNKASKRQSLWTYSSFRGVLDAFRRHYDLGQFGYKDLDKFLWEYGYRVFRKASAPQMIPVDA